MGGGKGGGDSEVRFAEYLEDAHDWFLSDSTYGFQKAFKEAFKADPYADRPDMSIEDGFLGSGYTVDQFPSLFDMFGKFMAGLDIDALWTQLYNLTTDGPEVDNLISSFSEQTLDRMNEESLPVLHAGMRDIGAINSTAFAMGRALLESRRQKEITKFSAQIEIQMLQLTHERWKAHLGWNQNVMSVYGDFMRAYYAGAMDVDQLNYKYKEASALWKIHLYEPARAILGALTGSPATTAGGGPSQVNKSIGGAMSGAASGAMIGSVVPGVGTAVGAAVGGALGLASSFF